MVYIRFQNSIRVHQKPDIQSGWLPWAPTNLEEKLTLSTDETGSPVTERISAYGDVFRKTEGMDKHYHSWSQTSEESGWSCGLGQLPETAQYASLTTFALVDLGKKGVGGLREDCSGETLFYDQVQGVSVLTGSGN
jgi:hypothetical protein